MDLDLWNLLDQLKNAEQQTIIKNGEIYLYIVLQKHCRQKDDCSIPSQKAKRFKLHCQLKNKHLCGDLTYWII